MAAAANQVIGGEQFSASAADALEAGYADVALQAV
jgi:hypothetical protein